MEVPVHFLKLRRFQNAKTEVLSKNQVVRRWPFPSVLEAGSRYPVIDSAVLWGRTSELVDEHLLGAPIHPRGV